MFNRYNRFAHYFPVLIGILLLLPRVSSAQFGLLDDGNSILVGQAFAEGNYQPLLSGLTNGLFRPFYWFFLSSLYLIWGTNALGYYLTQTLLLCGIITSLIYLTYRQSAEKSHALLVGITFLLTGSVLESFYTLSKPEVPLVALLMLTLLALNYIVEHPLSKMKWVLLAGIFFLQFLSLATKEVAAAMIPITLGWALLAWWSNRQTRNSTIVRTLLLFGLIQILAIGIYLIIRSELLQDLASSQLYSQNYQISFSRIIESLVRWSGWIIRDFSYLVPVLGVWLISGRSIQTTRSRRIALASFIWIAGWFGIYLPWRFVDEFYLLPLAIGSSILTVVIVFDLIKAFKSSMREWQRVLVVLALLFSGSLYFTTLINNFSNARYQLSVDKTNSVMLRELSELAPVGSSVYLNIHVYTEYLPQIESHLHTVYDRADIQVEAFGFQDHILDGSESSTYVITPSAENAPMLKMRGPSERNFTDPDWQKAVTDFLEGAIGETIIIRDSIDFLNIDLPRLFCPFMRHKGYCQVDEPIIDTDPFSYQWVILKLEPNE